MSNIVVTVPTDGLRRLLDDAPDVKLQLQSLAAEKIAEEIVRKAQDKFNANYVEAQTKRIAGQVYAELKSKWTFPAEGKRIVEELAVEAVTRALRGQKDTLIREVQERARELMKTADQRLKDHEVERHAAFLRWAEVEVCKLARDEFIATLRSVKETIT